MNNYSLKDLLKVIFACILAGIVFANFLCCLNYMGGQGYKLPDNDYYFGSNPKMSGMFYMHPTIR